MNKIGSEDIEVKFKQVESKDKPEGSSVQIYNVVGKQKIGVTVEKKDKKRATKLFLDIKYGILGDETKAEKFRVNFKFKTYSYVEEGKRYSKDLTPQLNGEIARTFAELDDIMQKIWGREIRPYDYQESKKSPSHTVSHGFRRNGNEALDALAKTPFKESAKNALAPLTLKMESVKDEEYKKGLIREQHEALKRITVIEHVVNKYDQLVEQKIKKETDDLKSLENKKKEKEEGNKVEKARDAIKAAKDQINKLNKKIKEDEISCEKEVKKFQSIIDKKGKNAGESKGAEVNIKAAKNKFEESRKTNEDEIKVQEKLVEDQEKILNETSEKTEAIKVKIELLERLRIDRFAVFVAAALTPPSVLDEEDTASIAEISNQIQNEVQNRFDIKRKELIKDFRDKSAWYAKPKEIPEAEVKEYSIDAGGLASSALGVCDGRVAYDEYLQQHAAKPKKEGLEEELMQLAYGHIDQLSEGLINKLVSGFKSIYSKEVPKDKIFNEKGLRDLLNQSVRDAFQVRGSLLANEPNEAIDLAVDKKEFGVLLPFELFVDPKKEGVVAIDEDDKGKEEKVQND